MSSTPIPGLRTCYRQVAIQTVTSSTVLVPSTNLLFKAAANSTYHISGWIPFTCTGAVSGVKFQLSAPDDIASYLLTYIIYSLPVGHVAIDNAGLLATATPFTGTLANAGDDLMTFEADIITESAGNITLEFAQKVSDTDGVLIAYGGFLSVTQLK